MKLQCRILLFLWLQESWSFQPSVSLPTLKASRSGVVTLRNNRKNLALLSSATHNTPRHGNHVTRLLASATEDSDSSSNASEGESKLDVDAILKYGLALALQMSLFTALFTGLDKLVTALGVQVPFAVNVVFFYFLALKSRVLNPLQNTRPQVNTKEIENAQQRKMPSWTPPGFIFPIVWLLLIGPLRAFTSSLIYSVNGGSYASFAILSLMFHLSIGDIWNTINNVERRYGTSFLGVLCVWTSAAFAAFQYYQVLPLAGQLLSLKLIWLTVASSLIFQTWRLNPNPKTGKRYSLLPKTGEGAKTEFTML